MYYVLQTSMYATGLVENKHVYMYNVHVHVHAGYPQTVQYIKETCTLAGIVSWNKLTTGSKRDMHVDSAHMHILLNM